MMDTLISGFAEESRLNDATAEPTNPNRPENSVITNVGSFTNKLSKFTLATFDDQGMNSFRTYSQNTRVQNENKSKNKTLIFQVVASVKWARGRSSEAHGSGRIELDVFTSTNPSITNDQCGR